MVGKPGNEYQVTVRNRSREDVLAVVSVDGVNVISGETAHPSQTGSVLSAHGSYDILGWRKSLAETAAEQDSRLGTGHGRREASHARHVTFERASTAPAETLRPFPGFVPDPRG